MTSKKVVPITDRVIPGITWKVIWPVLVGLAALIWSQFSTQQMATKAFDQSQENGEVLKEIQAERKRIEEIHTIQMTDIKLNQREFAIRLTTLEEKNKKP